MEKASAISQADTKRAEQPTLHLTKFRIRNQASRHGKSSSIKETRILYKLFPRKRRLRPRRQRLPHGLRSPENNAVGNNKKPRSEHIGILFKQIQNQIGYNARRRRPQEQISHGSQRKPQTDHAQMSPGCQRKVTVDKTLQKLASDRTPGTSPPEQMTSEQPSTLQR